jgi:fructuronate reductase
MMERLSLRTARLAYDPSPLDVGAYKQALLRRFRDPGLRHRTWRIAMDGSQKLPQRLLGTIMDRRKAGQPIDLRDPLRQKVHSAGGDAAKLAPLLLSIEAVFARDLPGDVTFTAAVTRALDSLLTIGSKKTCDAFRNAHP